MSRLIRHIASDCPRVSFLIGGAQKCGTNALYALLAGYPGISLSFRKETRFFLNNRYYRREPACAEIARDYHMHFPSRQVDAISGEATPEYIWYPLAVARIRRYNPSMRWLVCLRNPISRAHSQWKMWVRHGETRSFEICVTDALSKLSAARSPEEILRADPHGLLTRGLYYTQLQRLFENFGQDRVHVIFMSTMRLLPGLVRQQAFQFLSSGIRPKRPRLASAGLNGEIPLASDLLDQLWHFFGHDVEMLQKIFGEDLGTWRAFPASH